MGWPQVRVGVPKHAVVVLVLVTVGCVSRTSGREAAPTTVRRSIATTTPPDRPRQGMPLCGVTGVRGDLNGELVGSGCGRNRAGRRRNVSARIGRRDLGSRPRWGRAARGIARTPAVRGR